MEIKNIEKSIEANYPKQNEISNKKLKTYIPKKWTKLGITSFVFGLLLKNKSFAFSAMNIDDITPPTMGATAPPSPIPYYDYLKMICGPLSIIFGIVVLINLILVIHFKLKAKKENKKMKLPKALKIFLIISIIILIVNLSGYIVSLLL